MPPVLPPSSLHSRAEGAFRAWARWVIRWRWSFVFAPLALTLWLGSLLGDLEVDNSQESYLLPNDPVRVAYDEFRERFGQDEVAVIGIETPEVFDLVFLERLRALHEDLEREVPNVEEVTSLLNARSTRGEADELIVEDFLESWPTTSEQLGQLRARALDNPFYLDRLINRDATFTTLMVEPAIHLPSLDGGDPLAGFDDETEAGAADGRPRQLRMLDQAESVSFVDAVEAVVARHDAPGFRVRASGNQIGSIYTSRLLERDQSRLLPVTVAINALILGLLFRRVTGVLLPLLVVLAALVATRGSMVLLGIPDSACGQIIPPLLLCVGFCDAVHILTIVFQRLDEGAERDTAIVDAFGHSGLSVLLTSLTTAGGLASFLAADIGQVHDVGRIAPIGILFALALTVTALPALLAVVPLRAKAPAGSPNVARRLSAGLAAIGDASARRPVPVLLATAVVVGVGALGARQLSYSQDTLSWFPAGDPVRETIRAFDRELRGAETVEIVIDTGREDGLKDPKTLERIAAAGRWAVETFDGEVAVGKAISVLDVVRETHRALHEDRPEFYRIPQDRRLLAQELLLFETSGPEELEDLVDTRFQLARLSLTVPQVDGAIYSRFQQRLRTGLAPFFRDDDSFVLTGSIALAARSFEVLNSSMVRSYALALAIISPLMVLMIGNLRRGLLAMIPNLLPVFLTLGLMGALDIPIDISTLLIGSIVIGLAVDDTIHFMHKFQRYYARCGDVRQAVRDTLETTGAALLITTLVLLSGFTVMGGAYMLNMKWFALLSTFAVATAFLADVVLAPALLATFGGAGASRVPQSPPRHGSS